MQDSSMLKIFVFIIQGLKLRVQSYGIFFIWANVVPKVFCAGCVCG